MSDNTTLKDFIEYELYPTLFDNIDTAFPDMSFVRVGEKWISPYHINGDKSNSKDQTFIASARKNLIKDNSATHAISLIDFEIENTGADFITAVKRLASACNLELPNYDSEKYKDYQKKQEQREDNVKIFTSALWSGSPEANEVLNYLRSRKWTDEDIRKAELGYIDSTILNTLPDKENYTASKNLREKGDVIGTSHRLTIPYRNGSRIFGFKFRNIAFSDEDKKKGRSKYLNSTGLAKSEGLFGMGIGYKDITIVEGELDALHAKVKGYSNIVATTGGAIGEKQIEDAIKRGAKRFTLLFDNDERGKGFIASTIENLQRYGVSIFVASLPDEVKDTDEFLGDHTIQEWKEVIDNTSKPVCLWKCIEILTKYYALTEQQNGGLTYKQREDLFAEAEAVINSPYTLPTDRELVFGILKDNESTLRFSTEDFRNLVNRDFDRQQDVKRKKEVEETAEKLSALVKEGKTDEAVKLMGETATKQGSKGTAEEYASVFASNSPTDYANLLSQIQEGIPTGYTFQQGAIKEPLTLNAGLTFVCAYRGHGKTSFLNNVALNEVRRNIKLGNDKNVLYFSYEVDKRRLIADLLNTYVNEPLISRNPVNSIQAYFKGKGFSMFTENGRMKASNGTDTIASSFETKKDRFLRNYLSSGRLVIVEENYKVEKLLDAIKFYLSTHSVSLICIDYAQLIYSENYSRQRTEEIKAVVNDIKDFANKEGIPFLMACQFNREVDSPISVDTKNIGEGGDFERIADTCIGLFNLKELHPLPKAQQEEKEVKRLLEGLGVQMGDSLKPIQGKLFVRLLKRRYGYYPIDTILEWKGSTKYITPNDPDALEIKAEEVPLPFD